MKKQPVRGLHLITGLGTGGAELSLSRLLRQLDRDLYPVKVVCLGEDTPLAQTLREEGIEVLCLNWKKGRVSLKGLYRLWRTLKEFNPSYLQTWLYHADLVGLIVGRFARVPKIFWTLRCAEMDMSLYSWSSRLVLWLNCHLSSWVDGILCNSHAGKRVHQELGYKNSSWTVIPNGIDGEKFCPLEPFQQSLRQAWGLPEHKLVIGIVGRLDPMKDYGTFFAAASAVSQALEYVHFLVVGPNMKEETPQVAQWIEEYNLQGRVTCIGEEKNIPLVMGLMDLFCSSSRGEGFPNVVAEALACGLPCVVTRVGDSPRLVKDPWGEGVPPQNPHALAQALIQWAQLTPEDRQRRGAAGREFVVSTYGLAPMVRQYEKVWRTASPSSRRKI